MKFKFSSVDDVRKSLRWCVTKFNERKNEGLFPRPINFSGSPKSNLYFDAEIDYYVTQAIFLKTDEEFRALAKEIEENRKKLKMDRELF